MATGTQPTFGVSSMPDPLALDPTSHNVIPLRPQSFKRAEPIQIQGEIQLSAPVVSTTYSDSAYQWLIEVLDGLIDFGRRHGHYGIIKLTRDEYQWIDDVLEELICSVGENESHPLAPLMEFIIQLIDNYEDTYVPKLTELFPELAAETPIEASTEKKQPVVNTPKLSDAELAANAFFSMGYLLDQGSRTENAILAYDKAVALKPDFWKAFYNVGIARYDSRKYAEAMTNFDKAIELNHNFVSAYYNRGILKSELKGYEGAIADFDKAIALGLNSFEAYCHRAFAKTALDQYDAAVSDYDKAIALNQDFVGVYEVYNILGILRSELGQYNEALADYAEAIRIKPDYAEAYAYRGVLKVHLDRINEARADFQTALELAERQGDDTLKTRIVEWVQELNDFTPQDSAN